MRQAAENDGQNNGGTPEKVISLPVHDEFYNIFAERNKDNEPQTSTHDECYESKKQAGAHIRSEALGIEVKQIPS